jgi:hypothetical protein
MDNLEKYINDNLEQLDSYEMPQGHKERFMAKIEALEKSSQDVTAQEPTSQRRKITFWNRKRFLSAVSAAAVVAIGLITALSPAVQEAICNYRIQKSAQQIYIVESEIMQMLGEDEQYMINSLKTITEEAVPLAEQLPAELSPRQRAEILIRYYKAKTASLKSFKTLYAQGGETDSEY